jgi:dCTP deaminase
MRICSFTFEEVSSKVDVPYRKKVGNKYAGQTDARASKLSEEVSVENKAGTAKKVPPKRKVVKKK